MFRGAFLRPPGRSVAGKSRENTFYHKGGLCCKVENIAPSFDYIEHLPGRRGDVPFSGARPAGPERRGQKACPLRASPGENGPRFLGKISRKKGRNRGKLPGAGSCASAKAAHTCSECLVSRERPPPPRSGGAGREKRLFYVDNEIHFQYRNNKGRVAAAHVVRQGLFSGSPGRFSCFRGKFLRSFPRPETFAHPFFLENASFHTQARVSLGRARGGQKRGGGGSGPVPGL